MSYYPERRDKGHAQAMRNCQSVTKTRSSEPYHYPSAWNECSTTEQQLLESLYSQPNSPPSNSNSISSLDTYPPTPSTSPPLSLTKHAHHSDAMKNIDLTTGQAILDPNELRKGPLRISSPNFHESLSTVYVHSPYCELGDPEAGYNSGDPVGVNTAAAYPPPVEEMDAEFLQLIRVRHFGRPWQRGRHRASFSRRRRDALRLLHFLFKRRASQVLRRDAERNLEAAVY